MRSPSGLLSPGDSCLYVQGCMNNIRGARELRGSGAIVYL